jgi:hypothetical protein
MEILRRLSEVVYFLSSSTKIMYRNSVSLGKNTSNTGNTDIRNTWSASSLRNSNSGVKIAKKGGFARNNDFKK